MTDELVQEAQAECVTYWLIALGFADERRDHEGAAEAMRHLRRFGVRVSFDSRRPRRPKNINR